MNPIGAKTRRLDGGAPKEDKSWPGANRREEPRRGGPEKSKGTSSEGCPGPF